MPSFMIFLYANYQRVIRIVHFCVYSVHMFCSSFGSGVACRSSTMIAHVVFPRFAQTFLIYRMLHHINHVHFI